MLLHGNEILDYLAKLIFIYGNFIPDISVSDGRNHILLLILDGKMGLKVFSDVLFKKCVLFRAVSPTAFYRDLRGYKDASPDHYFFPVLFLDRLILPLESYNVASCITFTYTE